MEHWRIPNPETGQLGKYDEECADMLVKLKAKGIALVVIGGPKGSGFSVSVANNPALLRIIGRAMAEAGTQLAASGTGPSHQN